MARELAGFNPDSWRVAAVLGPHLYQVADAVIEAVSVYGIGRPKDARCGDPVGFIKMRIVCADSEKAGNLTEECLEHGAFHRTFQASRLGQAVAFPPQQNWQGCGSGGSPCHPVARQSPALHPKSVKLFSENRRDNAWVPHTQKLCGARTRTEVMKKSRTIPQQERSIPGETYPKTRVVVVFDAPPAAEKNVQVDLWPGRQSTE